ncbi:MAG TPA: RusA family crossover junction endodeoxyribonuclease [Rhodospirillaceae bacterium]|nr:MAG: hypothetical protein A2018_05710 [Alphaproteobacteria bacterium GWF2_58_20]HAU29011.1 RusA family crossover junction endodeoxyribonuclease [Rhodospirillaceae bacterium]
MGRNELKPIRFSVPGVPMGKARPRFCWPSHGRMWVRTPAATKSKEQQVGWEAKRAMSGRPMLDEAVRVEIIALFAPPASWPKWKKAEALAGKREHTAKPDIDNIAKLVCDGLNGIAWTDDAHVVALEVKKQFCEHDPRMVVTITPMQGRK